MAGVKRASAKPEQQPEAVDEVRMVGPSGAVTIVPASIVDALIESGYIRAE